MSLLLCHRVTSEYKMLFPTGLKAIRNLRNVEECLWWRSLMSQQRIWRYEDGSEDLQDDPKSGLPSASPNADTIANISKTVTRDGLSQWWHTNWRRRFVKSFMKICGRDRPSQSSSLEDTWTCRSNGDLNNVKALSRLVKIINNFFVAYVSFLR